MRPVRSVTYVSGRSRWVVHPELSALMEWEVEFTEEFETWWNGLTLAEQEAVNAKVMLLQKIGPLLSRPHADVIHASRHPNMKELRIQHSSRPY